MGQQHGRRSRARLVAGALLTAALTSCAGGAPVERPVAAVVPVVQSASAPASAPPPVSTESGLAGVVQSREGVPLNGALVAVIPAVGFDGEPAGLIRSSDGGRFRVDHLKPGQYGITVTAPGRTGGYLEVVTVRPGEILEGLTPRLGGDGFTVRGVVFGEDGRPARGAAVLASRLSDFEADCFVVEGDEQGYYSVTLPRADYAIRAMAKAAGTVSEPVKVVGARDRAIDLQLEHLFAPDKPAPDEVVAWLKQSAVPLSTLQAGNGFADMQPLRDIVGRARVVSLGEATPGTREFFQLKHRMLEFLVSEMGFSVFGIEASFPESLAVNDYVLTGKGDPADALAGMRSWTLDTEEVLDLIRWMRRYNEDPKHTKKVKFYGFDMQFAPAASQALLRYLEKVDRGSVKEAERTLAPLDNDFGDAYYAQRPAALLHATEVGLGELVALLEKNRGAYEKRSSAGSWKLARLHAEVVRQAAQNRVRPWKAGARDRSMADNVKALLDLEGQDARMVLWAHNAHVSRGEGMGGGKGMGSWLHEMLGPEQVVFGFAFAQGSFQAMELSSNNTGGGNTGGGNAGGGNAGGALQSFTVGPPPPGSLEGALARTGQPRFAVDLRKAAAGSLAAAWLGSRLQSRSIGAGYRADEEQASFLVTQPSKLYDALFFVDKASAVQPTPTGRSAGGAPWKPVVAASPSNLSLEDGPSGGPPAGWQLSPERAKGGYRVELIGQLPRAGKRSAVVRRDSAPWRWGMGSLTQSFSAEPFRGKRVRLRAASRAEVKGVGNEAELFLSAAPASRGEPTLFVSTSERPITTKTWRYYEVEGVVPADADVITVGLVLAGNGRAYLDDVSFKSVGGAPGAARN